MAKKQLLFGPFSKIKKAKGV